MSASQNHPRTARGWTSFPGATGIFGRAADKAAKEWQKRRPISKGKLPQHIHVRVVKIRSVALMADQLAKTFEVRRIVRPMDHPVAVRAEDGKIRGRVVGHSDAFFER